MYLYFSGVRGMELKSIERGLFFIWALQLTALFHEAIWLCVYKREVRGGQKVLGIKQASYIGQSGCVLVYVCVFKTTPPGAKKTVHAPVQGFNKEKG